MKEDCGGHLTGERSVLAAENDLIKAGRQVQYYGSTRSMVPVSVKLGK
jgi:hypothetical protein